MSNFACKVITPEGVSFDKEIWQLTIKTRGNAFSIRAHHADLIFASDSCTAEIAFDEQTREMWAISNSLLEVANNKCVITCRSSVKQ